MKTFTIELITGLIVLVAVAVLGLIAAIPIVLLWNWLVPSIFDLPEITYLQAWGLFWLTSLLFKSYSSSHTSS